MRKLLFLMGFGFALSLQAQDYDFGDVSKAELKESYCDIDSTASACYLYKYRKTYLNYEQSTGFELITEVHERIKIYNKEGLGYATKSVKLFKNGNEDEQLNGIKGYTYSLVGDEISKDKLKKDGVFKTELSKYRDEVKFTMPNANVGSIIEFKYKVNSPFFTNVEAFVFQHDIPTKKLNSKFESPEYFSFKLNTKGYMSVVPHVERKPGKITLHNKTRTGGDSARDGSVRTTYTSENIDFLTTVSTYDLENIPALKKEPYVNNIDNYRSSVKYELSYTQFPNSGTKNYTTTWEDVVKRIYESSSFGGELSKTGYFKNDIDVLTRDISDPIERASRIYNFVKTKIKWNGYYGYLVNDGVRKAYKNQVGNVAEINLMLTAMLNHAGVKAYPVLVSTRQNGIPLFPTREGYNYVVTYVKDANQEFLLDATSNYSLPNILPFRTLNWQGRVITEHGNSKLINLYPNSLSKNDYTIMVNMDNEGTITGGCRSVKTGHSALDFRIKYNNQNKDQYLEDLESKYGDLEVSDFSVKNENDLTKPVMQSYKFIKEAQADVVGDKLYFSPMFYFKIDENPFKLENRDYPIDFGYPTKNVYKIIINIPEGYKIDELPEGTAVVLPDNLGAFKYNLKGNGRNIQLVVSTQINSAIVNPTHYEILKMYISQLVEKEAEQIVISKV
ncbi:transglutaminase-like domain-containing protein [Cognatitamlana onchidii]|uniref:transglutaminase-like domain-containing protein n=1 Tax=Cognatitamlana onchidii TaxID=2562860 RepID=UPI0010A6A8C6|nr:transglutaminase-like domain-containing protein [Algibacter onchidii]